MPCELFTSFLVHVVIGLDAVTVCYFIVVSGKLFLSQSIIFTFCGSSSPLQPTTGAGERDQVAHGLK